MRPTAPLQPSHVMPTRKSVVSEASAAGAAAAAAADAAIIHADCAVADKTQGRRLLKPNR